jgi:polyisoprenyl-phosphate glycosyltransferase
MNPEISIVVPVYGCKESLIELYERLKVVFTTMGKDFEIIFIEDNCPQASWEIIKKLAARDQRVKGLLLSRNFGQHKAITAGLENCQGDWVVVMDCDLQDQPEEILKLYNKAQEGYEVVFGKRNLRKDNFFKKLSSKVYYWIFNYLTDNSFDNTIANFSIVNKKVIKNILKLSEHNRAYPLLINWIGFKTTSINVEHCLRLKGKSAYNFSKSLNLAIDLIISHSNKPLRLSIKFGILMSFISLILGIFYIIRKLTMDISVEGWTSLMVIILFISGLIFANLGILGLYIGKIFDESKNRPLYVVTETTGFDEKS